MFIQRPNVGHQDTKNLQAVAGSHLRFASPQEASHHKPHVLLSVHPKLLPTPQTPLRGYVPPPREFHLVSFRTVAFHPDTYTLIFATSRAVDMVMHPPSLRPLHSFTNDGPRVATTSKTHKPEVTTGSGVFFFSLVLSACFIHGHRPTPLFLLHLRCADHVH